MSQGYMPAAVTDLWSSPKHIVDMVRERHGLIICDPASDGNNSTADSIRGHYFTKEDDGLAQDWIGTLTYINPPYGRGLINWVSKAIEQFENGNSETIVMLLPSRSDTKWFHLLYEHWNCKIEFIKGRLKFGTSTNSAPFPSIIVTLQKSSTL